MKVGDLVKLSQKGHETLWCKKFRDMVGVVTEIVERQLIYDLSYNVVTEIVERQLIYDLTASVKYYTVMFTGKKGTRQQTRIPRSYLKFV